MKERLVEDWLIRINERGYEVPFSQSLISKGHQILRSGHSPTEHGKDVLTIAADGEVWGFQLKTGDFAQADILKHQLQINMLVETRPIFPGLPATFSYRPCLVTTGEFKEPAISLVSELNASWRHRHLPELNLINGRRLHVDFVGLSSDFWPIEPPAVRDFLELYLVRGKGDLAVSQYANFLLQLLTGAKSGIDMERRAAAANVFASYLLGHFYEQADHWSIFQGWIVCAAQIGWAGLSGEFDPVHWRAAFNLSRQAGLESLENLAKEVLKEKAFRVSDRELDDLTRTRNTFAVAGAACLRLIESKMDDAFSQTVELVKRLLEERRRLFFWGEGAFSQFVMLLWLLERGNQKQSARDLLLTLIKAVAERNSKHSKDAFEDPYVSADDCLLKLLNALQDEDPKRPQAVESYSLFPLVLLAARRDLRTELEQVWTKISHVDLTWFRPEIPADALRWRCGEGKDYSVTFDRPQSWKELKELAFRDDRERLPQVITDDTAFGLMFMLAFPHRILPSLVKNLDDRVLSLAVEEPHGRP